MTQEEIKNIVKKALTFTEDYLNFEKGIREFKKKIIQPVKKAIAENDKTVVEYLKKCNKTEQFYLATSVVAGVKEKPHKETVELYLLICKNVGATPDPDIKLPKEKSHIGNNV